MIIQELKSQTFVASAQTLVEERFLLEFESLTIENIVKYAPEELIDKAVIRLKRKDLEFASYRTILITVMPNCESITSAFKWAANVKDLLLNPETADLYLFIGFRENSLSLEQSLKYEANELFCRKFILRSEESIEEFMARTFLPAISSGGHTDDLTDPLYSAFIETSKQHTWLTRDIISIWKEAFLSGKSSSELVEMILTNLENPLGDDTIE